MLITLIVLLVALFSGGVEWQSAAAANAKPVPTITPQDPSSLTLALIGAGMLAVYLAVSRTIRGRRPLIRTQYAISESTRAVDERDSGLQRQSRGAA